MISNVVVPAPWSTLPWGSRGRFVHTWLGMHTYLCTEHIWRLPQNSSSTCADVECERFSIEGIRCRWSQSPALDRCLPRWFLHTERIFYSMTSFRWWSKNRASQTSVGHFFSTFSCPRQESTGQRMLKLNNTRIFMHVRQTEWHNKNSVFYLFLSHSVCSTCISILVLFSLSILCPVLSWGGHGNVQKKWPTEVWDSVFLDQWYFPYRLQIFSFHVGEDFKYVAKYKSKSLVLTSCTAIIRGLPIA